MLNQIMYRAYYPVGLTWIRFPTCGLWMRVGIWMGGDLDLHRSRKLDQRSRGSIWMCHEAFPSALVVVLLLQKELLMMLALAL